MSARRRVEAILTSAAPDWGSVSLRDIRYYIQRQIRRYKHLRRSIRPDAAKKAESIRGEWKKLSCALAGKLALRGLADIDKAILELEGKMKEPERINPFDSYELEALKSERDRLRREQPALPPRRKLQGGPLRGPGDVSSSLGTSTASPFAKVAQLNKAFSTEFDELHTHFVKWPTKPGVQPCLIELKQLDGTVKLIDTLTVLPSASCKEVVDPIYAAYLNLIGREYESDIEQVENRPEIKTLAAKHCSDPPFMCAALTQVRQRIFAATETREVEGRLSPLMRQEFEELVHTVTGECFWHPRHLITDRTRTKWKKAWAILARWDEWELKKLSWAHRLVVHSADMGELLLLKKAQKQDALRKICKSLGLQKGDLSPFKRALSADPPPTRKITL